MYSERGRYVINIYIYIYISREISIEHPSVGLASLAQLENSSHLLESKLIPKSMSHEQIQNQNACALQH